MRKTIRRFAEGLDDVGREVCSYRCKVKLGSDISTTDGAAYALENRLFIELCSKMVATAVEIVEEFIA